ncbi:vWA domain-containing protein [Legionella maioricensis]|uniref:VWA domain-containing protein n=1 Tax=Legionella maioricensis TaxID=2896528 RepID=A0A9X2CY55_9GAMM|nr:VWA domain-containing protein [Legionella maioricensis]MCL9682948.1 VWA domain-containing protein [Legionella maioricensis]MCL9686296.1 VWA domain-containing protein [Legionella maioricensis]
MMAEFHFLRPWWLMAIIPLIGLAIILWRQTPQLHAWSEVCDSHLLEHLLQKKGKGKRMTSLSFLFLSALFMIFSMAGPTWHKLPVPTYKSILPRVLLLDMSSNMMISDLSPNRLSRAKFKLHDLFERKDVGQIGLIVFTGEPFVVSPLTDDGQTISSLLSTLTPDIMPVGGQKLDVALNEASQLIQQAGYKQGQILVLTADTPSVKAMETAKQLAQAGIISSIMPIKADKDLNPLFQQFANSGDGQLIKYSPDSSDLEQWINAGSKNKQFALSSEDDIPLWRDEGRWFLIGALLFLLPVFQRGWLQRVAV